MPWTDSRSREEWLAEVRRRGTRIRRRRRLGYSAVGALALVLPVSLTATALRTGPERAVELSVAGPAPVRGLEPLPPPPNELATGDVPAPAAAIPFEAPTTTVAEVHERVATGNGRPAPRASSPTTVPPADDPVVGRSTPATTIPSSGSTASTVPGGLMASSSSAPSSAAMPGPPECVADEFRLTISTDRSAYSPRETVRGTSVLEKRSPGTCLLPRWWLETSLLNGAGEDVSGLAREKGHGLDISATDNTCDEGGCRNIVTTGAVFTNTFYWETIDCTSAPPVRPVPPDDSHCVPFPGGTYRVVSYWTGPGSGAPAIATVLLGP